LVLFVGVGSTAAHAAEKRETPPSAKQITHWIQQLDDDAFSVRESASRKLLRSGKAAIEAVAKAAAGNSLEVTDRAVRILDELASSTEGATARSAKAALVELAASKDPAAAVRARTALRGYQQRVTAALQRCGAPADSMSTDLAPHFSAAQRLTFAPPLTDRPFFVLNMVGLQVGRLSNSQG